MINKSKIQTIAIIILAVVTLIAYSSYYMNEETQENIVELKSKETIKVGDLSLSHVGGGHKILPFSEGSRGGDMSIAEIEMQTPRSEKTKKRFYNESEKESFKYDNYIITLVDMTTDGQTVTLNIKEIDNI